MSVVFRLSAVGVALLCLSVVGTSPVAEAQGPQNPLGKLFRGLNREIRRGAEQMEWEKSGRDQLDLRPIQRSEDSRRLQRAQEMLRQQQWHDGLEILQFLLDSESDAFTVSRERDFHSLRDQVNRILSELPPEAQRNYENRFGPQAERLWQQARETQDERLLLELITRYRHTPAGREGQRALARLCEDRGDLGSAIEAWQRAAQSESDPAQREADQTRAAALLSLRSQGFRPTTQSQPQPLPAGSYEATPRPIVLPSLPLPVLLPRWSVQLIERYAVREQIETLATDLKDQGRALLPAATPLIVDNKVAIRTLRGLQVRDVSTGQLQWERRLSGSPEERMTPESSLSDSNPQWQSAPDDGSWYGELYEQHQLTSLLFRDEIYGGLSSDGRQLFAIEEQGGVSLDAPIYAWQRHEDRRSSQAAWGTNELTSYDLQTGRVRWVVGGRQLEDSFSRPLAGTFFFGPPRPYGAELYVIGEQDGEVSLFCLASQSGEPLWSQPLAIPGRPIGEDVSRRFWPCQPLVEDGIILCPTTCGWLVAVDQGSHELRWTYRFAARVDYRGYGRGDSALQSIQELNRRWSRPFLHSAAGKVVVAPAELPDEFDSTQPLLYCLDLKTGQEVWRQPKNDALYVAGIQDQQVIIVCTNAVSARKLEGKGEFEWTLPLEHSPTGQGLLVNDRLFLPIGPGKLLTIDLKIGRLEQELTFPEETELGNLAISSDSIVSLSNSEVLALPISPRDQTPQANPELLARAQLREARTLIGQQQPEAALEKLNRLSPDPLTPSLRDDVTAAKCEALMLLVRGAPERGDELLKQLQLLSKSPLRARESRRFRAVYELELGDWTRGVATCWQLLSESPPEEKIQEQTREIRVDAWVGGQLFRLSRRLTPEQQEVFQRLAEQAAAEAPMTGNARARLARALAFHPVGQRLELTLAREAEQAGDIAAAVIRRQRTARSVEPSLRTTALVEQARLFEKLGWLADANEAWGAALESAPVDRRSDVQAGLAAVRRMLPEQSAAASHWGDAWLVEGGGPVGDQEGLLSVHSVGRGLRQFDQWRLLHDPASQRIRVEEQATGRLRWSFPLRSATGMEHHANSGVRLQGPLGFFMHQGVLQAVAWPDERVRWSWMPDLRGGTAGRVAGVMDRAHFGLQPLSVFAVNHLGAYRNPSGYLLAANEQALLLLCKDWIALDPLTGEELWRDKRAPTRAIAQTLGGEWFVTPSEQSSRLRLTLDGSLLEDEERSRMLRRAVVIDDDQLVLLESKQKSIREKSEWTLTRVTSSDRELWKVTLPRDAEITQPDADTFLWQSSDDQFELLNLKTGVRTALAAPPDFPSGANRKISVLADQDRIYLFADEGELQFVYVNGPSIRVTRAIYAYGRDGKLQWWKDISSLTAPPKPDANDEEDPADQRKGTPWVLNLLVQDFHQMPLLLLVGERPGRRGDLYFQQLRVVGIDKATGAVRCDWSRPTESSGFSYLHVDLWQKVIELRTYHERFFVHVRKSEP